MTPTPTDEELRQDLDSWHLLPWALPKWPEPTTDLCQQEAIDTARSEADFAANVEVYNRE